MNREILITIIENEIKFEREPEVNLMRAVIKQAFIDLLIISDKPKYKKLKENAREWFEEESSEFDLVCSLAFLKQSRIKMLYALVCSIQ